MNTLKPTYEELAQRLAAAEPIIAALKHHEVDAVIGKDKIAFLLLQEVGQALLASDAGFRAMFELSGVGMVQADSPSFRFTKVNQKFCDIVGYAPEELLTKTYLGLTDPRDRKRAMNELARVLRGQTDSWSIDKRCLRKDGTVIWVGINGTALRDDNGLAVRITVMISDITARKQAEQELHNRSEQLGKLAAELLLAQQRQRRRIARILNAHIAELLGGVKRRKLPAALTDEKSERQVLQAVQNFVTQSLAPAIPGKKSAKRRQVRHSKGVSP